MDYLKNRIFGTKKGTYGLAITLIGIVAFCWMLYARDDARAEYDQLKADGICFTSKAPDSWKEMSPEEQKKISRKCMIASNRLSQTEYGPSIFAILTIIGILLLSSSFVNIKSDSDKALEEFEEEEKKNDNELS